MKIGEALNHRKYLMNHIPQLLAKAQGCVTVVKDAPMNKAEPSVAELIAGIHKETAELRDLIVQINRTNAANLLPCGMSVMEAIAEREYLKQVNVVFAGIVSHIRPRTEKNYLNSDQTTYVVAEDVHPANIKQTTEDAAKRLRMLDNELQQANWTIDLVK